MVTPGTCSGRPATSQAVRVTSPACEPIVSQQLARLKASGIVVATRQGTIIRYAVADPLIEDLLRLAKQILNRRLVGVRSLLQELKRDSGVRGGSPSP